MTTMAKKETKEARPLKFVGYSEARAKLTDFIDESQGATIVITRTGKPVAMLFGIEGKTIEEVFAEFQERDR